MYELSVRFGLVLDASLVSNATPCMRQSLYSAGLQWGILSLRANWKSQSMALRLKS